MTTQRDLVLDNPQLITVEKNGDSLTAAAKNIRIELKQAFPGAKFSVTTSRFSMGDSISVRWTDGPTKNEVELITCKYVAGSFDGMEDIYNYEPTEWTKTFGDAKYISECRSYSDAAITEAIALLKAKYGDGVQGTAEDYKQGRLQHTTPIGNAEGVPYWSLQNLITRTMEHTEE